MEGVPCKTKSLNFLHLLDHSQFFFPPLITDNILEKEVSLIAFRQILPKILMAVYIFSNAIMTNLKKLIGNKSFNEKQSPAGLSPRIMPLNLYRKPWEWGRTLVNSQKFTNLPIQKNPPWYIFISHYQNCHSFYIK